MTHPTIVIVGRMNVGKSTLWNRIVGGSRALVSPIAGTTRDWREAVTIWRGQEIRFIDTGGVEHMPRIKKGVKQEIQDMQDAVELATKRVIGKADVLLFLVNAKDGLLPQDRALARLVLREKKPVILAVNKVDSPSQRADAVANFWKLGCGEPHPIAALTGAGVGDLLDVVIGKITETPTSPLSSKERAGVRSEDDRSVSPASTAAEPSNTTLRIAVIGKPNVGKSSLVNAILGEERVIVSPIAGTTREPIDTNFERDGKHYTLIDTAGIRRRAERTRTLESAGVERTLGALRRADIALLVLESHETLASQDLRIARTLIDFHVGVVIIANKWDLFHPVIRQGAPSNDGTNPKSQTNATKKYTQYLERQLPHISWAPILFISATSGRNVQKILATIEAVQAERTKRIPEEELTAWLKRLTYRPHKGKDNVRKPHVYGMKQVGITPPAFELVTEFKVIPTLRGMQKETVRESYIRFLENQLRASFGFVGTPLVVRPRTIE